MSAAEFILWITYTFIALAILGAGVCDLVLWLTGSPTISAYLRLHPAAFWGPVMVTEGFLLVLALHLYARGS
jgi:hypothetical protein